MQKQAPSLRRILVMVGFALSCFGLLLFLWLAFGGPVPLKPKGYRFEVSFKEAGQLAQEADVRISGVSVGKVKSIKPDKHTGLSDAVIEMNREYAPIPNDTRAILRQKTLLGETYVELTPGDPSSGKLPENGHLPVGQVAPTVELDEILRTFDAKTRAALRTWIQQVAVASAGRGQDISDAIGNLGPFAQDTTNLLEILNAQQSDLTKLVHNTGVVFNALSARDAQLRSLIENSNRVFETTALRNNELAQTFVVLPTFEREASTTLKSLTAFSQNANPLVTQLQPAARQLYPTLQEATALSPDLKALLTNLNPLFSASVKGLPALERFTDQLRPLLGNFDAPLRQLNPIFLGLSSYQSELTAFFANSVASTQATTPNGKHYLRTSNPLMLQSLAPMPVRPSVGRPNPYAFPRFFDSLKTGLQAYETRQCTSAPVTVTNDPNGTIPLTVQQQVQGYVQPNGVTPAPPCRQQPPFPFQGQVHQYPHVLASTGAVARSKQR